MTTPTTEQIEKLPKWAQNHIEAITRLRDRAQDALKKMGDSQTHSPIYVDNYGQTPRQFIQSNRIAMDHAGVHLEVFLAPISDGQRDFGIELQFTNFTKHRRLCAVGIIPKGTNTIALVAKENMR